MVNFLTGKFLASSAHMGWGAAFLLATMHHGWKWWESVLLLTVYAVTKEYWADMTWLEHDTWRGSTLDLTMYEVGAGLGILGFYYLWLSVGAAIGIVVLLAVLAGLGYMRRR